MNYKLKSREDVYLVAAGTVFAVMAILGIIEWFLSLNPSLVWLQRAGDVIVDVTQLYVSMFMTNIFTMMLFTLLTFLILAEFEHEMYFSKPCKSVPILLALSAYMFYPVICSVITSNWNYVDYLVAPGILCLLMCVIISIQQMIDFESRNNI